MWARKRIDIGWADLARAALWSALPFRAPAEDRIAETIWPGHDGVIACLTERSGFDLILQALSWPTGGEVLVSAVTIHDMVRIVEHHGLTAVPIDIDERDMSPRVESIERAVTPQTRAILVAHLFGAVCPMEPIIEWARARGVLVFEDCAQAFDGSYTGHPESDVVMFSFGPIKTATALGGGLLRVNDEELCRKVRDLHAARPRQSRVSFLKRVALYSLLKAIAGRAAFGTLVAVCRLLNRDHNSLLNNAVRNIPGDLLAGLRQFPGPPLLRLIQRRIRHFDRNRLQDRAVRGRLLARTLDASVQCPGADAETHSFWVFPARFDDVDGTIASLARAGFDATDGSQLQPVAAPEDRADLDPTHAREALSNTVYLPVYPEMPEREVERMGRVLLDALRQQTADSTV